MNYVNHAVNVMRSWCHFYYTGFASLYPKSVSQQKQQQEKIAGMDMHVGHSTVAKSMLRKGIMFAVQPEALSDVNECFFFCQICVSFSVVFSCLTSNKMTLGEITPL